MGETTNTEEDNVEKNELSEVQQAELDLPLLPEKEIEISD